MLSTRLEKLENDLNLLTAFQSLLLTESDNDEIGNSAVEIPERDSNDKYKIKCQNETNKSNSSDSKILSGRRFLRQAKDYNCSNADNTNNKNVSKVCQTQIPVYQDNELENDNRIEECSLSLTAPAVGQLEDTPQELERKHLEIELNLQRSNSIDLEESAKLIAIKLQKVEDELSREKETKKILLVGTLQLKNQIQGCENRISKLHQEIVVKKSENNELGRKIEAMEKCNFEVERQTNSELDKLRLEKVSIENDNKLLRENLQAFRKEIEDLQKQNSIKDQDLHSQDVKVTSQLSQIMTKCAQIRNENEKLTSNLTKAVERAKTLEEELLLTRNSLREMETTQDRDKVLHDCLVKKLQSDRNLQKERVDEQLRACHVVLSRTKTIFLGFQQERKEFDTCLTNRQKELTKLTHENKTLRKRFSALLTESRALKERLNSILVEKMQKVQQKENEIMALDYELRKSNADKTNLAKEFNVMKNKLSLSKKHFEDAKVEFDSEKLKLREDQSRLQQNCQVLQKVSEDQGQTIQKLRGDLEELRKLKYELETQIRDREADEKVLVRKLESETKKGIGLRDHIEELEYRIEGLEEDMRQHSCQDFVDSEYTERLESLELKLKSRYSEWQRALSTTKSERDQAVAAVQKAKEEAEVAKLQMEQRAFQISRNFNEEKVTLQKECHKSILEKTNKIYELESELERLKLQSTQMQRSLTSKIQQLQCALTMCLGSNPAATGAFSNVGYGTGFGNTFM